MCCASLRRCQCHKWKLKGSSGIVEGRSATSGLRALHETSPNLVIVDVCKAVKPARNFFALLECLYIFMSGSLMHSLFLDVQKRLGLSIVELQRLSDTLQTTATNSKRLTETRGLLEQLDISFLFPLSLFDTCYTRRRLLYNRGI